MPEFVLDLGAPEAAEAYNALDAFTQGYVEAMFFAETGYEENVEAAAHHTAHAKSIDLDSLARAALTDGERVQA